jgi:hypothetical protein
MRIAGFLAETGRAKRRMCVTNTSASSWCCTEDGRWPLEVGLQEQASNRPRAAAFKRRGGERLWKGVHSGRQVCVEEMNESKPSDDASLLR